MRRHRERRVHGGTRPTTLLLKLIHAERLLLHFNVRVLRDPQSFNAPKRRHFVQCRGLTIGRLLL